MDHSPRHEYSPYNLSLSEVKDLPKTIRKYYDLMRIEKHHRGYVSRITEIRYRKALHLQHLNEFHSMEPQLRDELKISNGED